jgi:hypothetical protein
MSEEAASRRKDAWTKEQDERLVFLRSQRLNWRAVGEQLDRTVESCCARYRAILPEEKRARFASARRWSEEDEATINRLVREGRKPRQIASYMGLPITAVYSKLQYLRQIGRQIHIQRDPRVYIPEERLIDRDRRLAAERDITSEFFGDPRPGQSALDKKMGEYA